MVAHKTDERHPKEQMLIHARAGTPREHETLALVAQGYSNAAIAAMLVATEATVAKHVRNIFDKLNLPESPTSTAACSPSSPTYELPAERRPERAAARGRAGLSLRCPARRPRSGRP
jgi:DNA-binding NarL/FixJ family response regulator